MKVYDKIKEIVNNEEKFKNLIIQLGGFEMLSRFTNEKFCDTDRCPYLEECKKSGMCEIPDDEYIDFILNMEAREDI